MNYDITPTQVIEAVFKLQVQLDSKCPFCGKKITRWEGQTWGELLEHLEQIHSKVEQS